MLSQRGARGVAKAELSACRSQEDAQPHASGGTEEAEFRTSREVQMYGGSVKNFSNYGKDKNIRILRCAGCQVPPLGD